jgi:deazaflavin-dependent oxidoreductase (nitroreductase family)
MDDRNARNQRVTDEFRANDGKVGGRYEGRPVLLLHDIGARSGLTRVHPLAYLPVGDSFAIFASKGGGPTNPDWYHNLVANPDVSVEVGTETISVKARVAQGEERERIWTRQKELYSNFAEYEKLTTRQIPVIILERAS